MLKKVINGRVGGVIVGSLIAAKMFFGGMVDAIADDFFVRGTVKDQAGEVVPGASYKVVDGSGNEFTGESGLDGRLEILVEDNTTAVHEEEKQENTLDVKRDGIYANLVDDGKVSLFNILGQRVGGDYLRQGVNRLGVDGLVSGKYFAVFESDNYRGVVPFTFLDGDIVGAGKVNVLQQNENPMSVGKRALEEYVLSGSKEGFIDFSDGFTRGDGKYDDFGDVIEMIRDTVKIQGRLIDTDTWEPNTSLQGWVAALGDTAYTDAQGNYSLDILPTGNVTLTAGYRDGNNNPASFIRTVRGVDGSENQSDVDIAVLCYNDLEYTSPEELKAIIVYANSAISFKDGIWEFIADQRYTRYENSHLLGLNQDQYFLLSKHSVLNDRDYTDEEMLRLEQDVDSIQGVLVRTFPILLDTSSEGFYPTNYEEAQNITLIAKGGPQIGRNDFYGDGRMDFIDIELLSPINYLGHTREEVISGLGGFHHIYDDEKRQDGLSLNGKTINYESSTEDEIKESDVKLVRLVNAITYDVGGLHPTIQVKDVLRLPNQ